MECRRVWRQLAAVRSGSHASSISITRRAGGTSGRRKPSFGCARGNERRDQEGDQRVVKPDQALLVNGVPLVAMEAESP